MVGQTISLWEPHLWLVPSRRPHSNKHYVFFTLFSFFHFVVFFISQILFYLCGSNRASCRLSVTPTESTTHASSWRSSPSSLRGDRERRRRQDVRRHGGSHQSGAMRIRASESVNWGHAIVAQNAVQNHELALVERYFGDSSSWRVCRRNIAQTGRRHLSRCLRMIK